MFTRQFYKAIGVVSGNLSDQTYTTTDGKTRTFNPSYARGVCAFNTKPDDTFYNAACTPYMGASLTSFSGNGGVVFGTGTTPPQLSDTTLSGDVVTGITVANAITGNVSENEAEITAIYTITNTSEADITIGEVGIVANLSSSASTASYKCLLERTVLETPITIAPGGVGQVTYTIRMNYPV